MATKGFKDLLYIGNQARPHIFDLAIRVPDVLYNKVVEVDERVTLLDSTIKHLNKPTRGHDDDDDIMPMSHQDDAAIKGRTGESIKGVANVLRVHVTLMHRMLDSERY